MGGQQVHGSPSASRGEPLFRDRVPYPRGALWKCPAWGRPVNVALNLNVGEAGAQAGAPSPLAMRSSGLCGVVSAARVDAGDCVERYSA